MPERKGRKRKQARSRPSSDRVAVPKSDGGPVGPQQTGEGHVTQRAADDNSIPALRARYAGFIVSVLTLTIGVLTLAQGIVGDYAVADASLRLGAGIALVVVALVIGVLALAPGRVAAWLRRS